MKPRFRSLAAAAILPWLATAVPCAAGAAGATFVVPMAAAPFPFDGSCPGDQRPFWDRTDEHGRRWHTTRYGDSYREAEHYRDDRVLFHVPPAFDPARPFTWVLWFHGQMTDLEGAEAEHRVTAQVDRSGVNAILVMPALPRKAADSHPGKLCRPGGFASFMGEAEAAAARRVPGLDAGRAAREPIVLAGYSGGFKAISAILERGGADGRIAGVILLDAIYDDAEVFAGWLAEEPGRRFLASWHTADTRNGNADLGTRLAAVGVRPDRAWGGGARAAVIAATSRHEDVPLAGPPELPLAAALRRFLPRREK